MKRLLVVLAAVPILTTWGAIKAQYAYSFDLGANLRTSWAVPSGGSLGASQPTAAASAIGMHLRDHIAVIGEFGVAEGEGNIAAGAWAGYAYRDWIILSGGLDSRFLFEETGIGPSASLAFLVPLTATGATGRLEARYTWFGRDAETGGAAVSLGFGVISPF